MKPVILTIIIILAISRTAGASGNWTGNELIRLCQAETSSVSYSLCLGYIRGAAEYHVSVTSLDTLFLKQGASAFTPIIRVCLPPGVDLGQVVSLFLKHMQEIPEQTHKAAVFLVGQTLNTAFPCDQGY